MKYKGRKKITGTLSQAIAAEWDIDLDDEDLAEWARTAGEAGDMATMLITQIALGEAKLDGMSAKDLCAHYPGLWPEEAEEIAGLIGDPEMARAVASQWGSPWPDED